MAAFGMCLAVIAACGGEDWECSAPSGSIATTGAFELTYVGETASFMSPSMRPRVVRSDDDSIELWACQERGEEMWIAEVTISRPANLNLPANFSTGAGAPGVTAVLTRYDEYLVLEETLGGGLGRRLSGTLRAFDATNDTPNDVAGALDFDAVAAEPCVNVQCQANDRTLTLTGDLIWESN